MLELVAKCKDPLETISVMHEEYVDVLFLDIQMPGLNGVDFLKTMPQRPLTVFTTAYAEYALEGYSLDIVDYLLKPFSFERFLQAVQKLSERLTFRAGLAVPEKPDAARKDFLLVKSEHKIHRLSFDQILYIQGMREYVAFHTQKGRIMSLGSLKNLEDELPGDQFARAHKSYIVSLSQISSMEGGKLRIGAESLPIGANYKEELLKRMR